MENISIRLTNFVLKKGVIQKEDYEIYQYGFQVFLELFCSVICSVIIALALNMKLECIIFFLFFIPLRSYGGGLHLETYYACLFFSCITLILALLITKYLYVPPLISFIIYFLSLLVLKLVGPVDHPNREVNNIENLIFIKRTNVVLFFSFLISILFWLLNFKTYLFLEAFVFLLVSVTSFLGKMKYSKK